MNHLISPKQNTEIRRKYTKIQRKYLYNGNKEFYNTEIVGKYRENISFTEIQKY